MVVGAAPGINTPEVVRQREQGEELLLTPIPPTGVLVLLMVLALKTEPTEVLVLLMATMAVLVLETEPTEVLLLKTELMGGLVLETGRS